jgi:hypothetical protein
MCTQCNSLAMHCYLASLDFYFVNAVVTTSRTVMQGPSVHSSMEIITKVRKVL